MLARILRVGRVHLIVHATIWGPHGQKGLRLAFGGGITAYYAACADIGNITLKVSMGERPRGMKGDKSKNAKVAFVGVIYTLRMTVRTGAAGACVQAWQDVAAHELRPTTPRHG